MARLTRKQLSKRRGLALVETAIVLPMLVLVSFAICEYGVLFVRFHQLTGITRHVGRLATLPHNNTSDVQDAITTLLAERNMNEGKVVTMPSNLAALPRGTPFTITIRVDYTSVMNLPSVLVPSQLTSTVTMAREGQP